MSPKASTTAFSPWYINTRRLADLTGTELDPHAQLSVADNNFGRVEAMVAARTVARDLIDCGKLENLANAVSNGRFPGSIVAGVWANMIFKGSGAAFNASERGRLFRKPSVKVQVVVGDSEVWLDGILELEHFYSNSSVTTLSGRKQMYIVGRFELEPEASRGTIQPWLIGDLVDVVDLPKSLALSVSVSAEIYPGSIDAFEKMTDVTPPSEGSLRSIMRNIPESAIKAAFASLIGEPFIPKDWGGERSDLYSSRLTIDGVETSSAFLLKGPSVPGPMHVADLGSRGDQIVRLFDEPAELLIIQHGNKIETTVRKTMRAFAIDPARPRRYCVIDGADTYRILRAYKYLDGEGNLATPD